MKRLVTVAIRYGLLAGVIGTVLLIGLFYLGRHPFVIPVFMDFRILLFAVFIFFTLREIRDYHQQGTLYFSQGIFSAFIFTLSYGVLSALLVLLFTELVPAFLGDYIRLSMDQLKSLPPEVIERIGNDVYRRNIDMLPLTRPIDLASLYFIQSFLISLFISIILSVILRRQPGA